MTTFYSQPCCPACVCTSQSTGPGSPHGALKVTSILCLQAEAGSLLPCLNKKKKGKDGEDKPCPAWARREKHHLDVRVCPLPGLMKAEGSADLAEWAESPACRRPCCSPAGLSALSSWRTNSYWLPLSFLSMGLRFLLAYSLSLLFLFSPRWPSVVCFWCLHRHAGSSSWYHRDVPSTAARGLLRKAI